MNARAPKGTADMLPPTARAWEHLTRTAQELFARYGYEPIYTPLFEHTDVFTRGIGEATDIVSKEMYTFEDKGGRSHHAASRGHRKRRACGARAQPDRQRASGEALLRRPDVSLRAPAEGPHAPVLADRRRAARRGRAHRGRRAHHAAVALLRGRAAFRRRSMRLLINSMGDENCRPAYREKVAAYIRDHADGLCEECNRRADTNPLRAFDCKNPACREIMGGAPLLRDELCDDCARALLGGQGATSTRSASPTSRTRRSCAGSTTTRARSSRCRSTPGSAPERDRRGRALRPAHGGVRRPADAGSRLRARVRAHAARDGGRRRRGRRASACRGLRRARRRRASLARRSRWSRRCATRESPPRPTTRGAA